MTIDDGQDFEQGLKLVRELIQPGKNQCAKPRNSTLSIYMFFHGLIIQKNILERKKVKSKKGHGYKFWGLVKKKSQTENRNYKDKKCSLN